MKYRSLVAAILITGSFAAKADLIQSFKDPSFSGIGWSSHVLTIDSVEKSRRDAIESQKKSDVAAQAAAAQNTTMSRFMNMFQNQVYSTLSSQLTSNLFKDNCLDANNRAIPGCNPELANPSNGTISIDANNSVKWSKVVDPSTGLKSVQLTIQDGSATATTLTVPISSFSF